MESQAFKVVLLRSLRAAGILLGHAVLWFVSLQLAMLTFGLSIALREGGGIAGVLGQGLWEYFGPLWLALSVVAHGVTSWVLFRSRWRVIPSQISWFRWGIGFSLFIGMFAGIWFLNSHWDVEDWDRIYSWVPSLIPRLATFGLAGEFSEGFVIFQIYLGILGAIISGLTVSDNAVRFWVLVAILVPGTLILGMARLVSEFRDWRAQPSLEEYAVYEAIARRNSKRHGLTTQVVKECGVEFTDVHRELVRTLGAEGAFQAYQKRQRQGCKMSRAFAAGSQLRVFPNDAMSPKLLGTLIDEHHDPMLIEIFSRVGFSPDGARAYLSRISLVQWQDPEYGRQATIARFGTTLTKADGSWEVDYGFEYDEWGTLSAKRTEAERKASIKAVRTLRGLWSAP